MLECNGLLLELLGTEGPQSLDRGSRLYSRPWRLRFPLSKQERLVPANQGSDFRMAEDSSFRISARARMAGILGAPRSSPKSNKKRATVSRTFASLRQPGPAAACLRCMICRSGVDKSAVAGLPSTSLSAFSNAPSSSALIASCTSKLPRRKQKPTSKFPCKPHFDSGTALPALTALVSRDCCDSKVARSLPGRTSLCKLSSPLSHTDSSRSYRSAGHHTNGQDGTPSQDWAANSAHVEFRYLQDARICEDLAFPGLQKTGQKINYNRSKDGTWPGCIHRSSRSDVIQRVDMQMSFFLPTHNAQNCPMQDR